MTNHLFAETLSIEGPDAIAFAQAQFSSKVSSLDVGHWQFSAWLDPQGRVRAFFHLARLSDEHLLLLLRGGDAATIADALRRFVFRSKLTLTAASPRTLATGPAMPVHSVHDHAGVISLGCETHSLRITTQGDGDDAWRLHQLRAGWPWMPASLSNSLLPAALSLQRLQAVAVDKGCYPGQEIVARLHFRGGHKRHLHRVTLSQAADAGAVLRNDEGEVGCVLEVTRSDHAIEALVTLRDDVFAQAADTRTIVFADGFSLHVESSWPA